MKIFCLVFGLTTICTGLSPTKTLSKANSIARAGKTVRKFIKGVSEFVSGKKPTNKGKVSNKNGQTSRSATKNKRQVSRKKVKTARKTPKPTTPASTDSDSGVKNFVGQLAIAGVSGGGLTMLQGLNANDSDYEYEYEYVTAATPSEATLTPVGFTLSI